MNGKQMMFSEEELALIGSTYKNNLPAFQALRAFLIPELTPDTPIAVGLMDGWSVDVNRTPEMVKLDLLARSSYRKHIETCLFNLWALSKSDVKMVIEAKSIQAEEVKNTIIALFKGNEKAIKLLRKVFLPYIDPEAPIDGMVDLWMTLDIENSTPEEVYIKVKARNSLIGYVQSSLGNIYAMAEGKQETPEEAKEREMKNSSK